MLRPLVAIVALSSAVLSSPALAQEAPPAPPVEVVPPPPPPAPEKPPEKPPKVAVSGYVHVQLNATSDANDDDTVAKNTFLIRRVRVRVKGEVVKGVGYTVMFDPSTSSNLLRDGYVSLGFIPQHELRIGQQKTQFGYDNPESTTRLYTVNRAYASDALARGSDLRDVGVGLFGTWKLPSGFGVDYQLTLVNGTGPNVVQDDTGRKNFWGRAGVSWSGGKDLGVKVGGSFATGDQLRRPVPSDPTMDFVFDFNRVGADVQVTTPWVFVVAELVQGDNDLPTGTVTGRGFYVTAVGKTPWNLGPIVRFEQHDPNTDADNDRLRRYTLGAYYDLVPVNVRLVANLDLDDSQTGRDNVFILFGQVVF